MLTASRSEPFIIDLQEVDVNTHVNYSTTIKSSPGCHKNCCYKIMVCIELMFLFCNGLFRN